MAKYRIGFEFTRTEKMPPGSGRTWAYRELSVEEMRTITDLLTKFEPTPVNCAFNSCLTCDGYPGFFALEFIVHTGTQFEAAQIAARLSAQAQTLFPNFNHKFETTTSRFFAFED